MKSKRRGYKGEVHLYCPRGAKTWWINYSVEGRARRKNTGKSDEGEARIFAAQVGRMIGLAKHGRLDENRRLLDIARELLARNKELQAEARHLVCEAPPTVGAWFRGELDALINRQVGDDRQLKPRSVARIRQVYEAFLGYLLTLPEDLTAVPLDRLSAADIRGYLTHLKQQGYAGGTRKFCHARISAALGRAARKRLIPVNPAAASELDPQAGRLAFDDRPMRRPFNPPQLAAVIAACESAPDRWLYLAALLGLFTAQRAGDICKAEWGDLTDLRDACPILRVRQTKTEAEVLIPIAAPLRRALDAVPPEERTGHLLPANVVSSYLYGSRINFTRPWRELFDRLPLAALADFPTRERAAPTGPRGRTRFSWSFHSFRHTTATYLSGPEAHYLLGHRTEAERRLGQTAAYRHADLQRLKAQLEAIPVGGLG